MQYLKETNSTNNALWELLKNEPDLPEGFILHTDFQTAGKGQMNNIWESEAGKNLLFSMLLYPKHIPVREHFLISQIVSLGIKKSLDKYTDHICVKWPNDIYWREQKIVGILIETSMQGAGFRSAICGIGVNVNQTEFTDKAPKAVSLKQITGQTHNREKILNEIKENILDLYCNENPKAIRAAYFDALYRKSGMHWFQDENAGFEAEIINIYPDGQLELQTKSGEKKLYYFKEVEFV